MTSLSCRFCAVRAVFSSSAFSGRSSQGSFGGFGSDRNLDQRHQVRTRLVHALEPAIRQANPSPDADRAPEVSALRKIWIRECSFSVCLSLCLAAQFRDAITEKVNAIRNHENRVDLGERKRSLKRTPVFTCPLTTKMRY